MADKKNRFGEEPYYCSPSSKNDKEEALEEARREAMSLDDDEDTIAGRWHS